MRGGALWLVFGLLAWSWCFVTLGDLIERDGVAALKRRDFAESRRIFDSLADVGSVDAFFYKGLMSQRGDGQRPDPAAAARWYQDAADRGSASAMKNLAMLYRRGEGVPRDLARAVDLDLKAEPAATAAALERIAQAYDPVLGARVPDAEVAAAYYRQAVAKGSDSAANKLAGLYGRGADGLPRDPVEARAWYRKAAERGDAVAQFNLALSLHRGENIAHDPAQAREWYRKAADQRVAAAAFNLGVMTFHGEGGPRDRLEAAVLFARARDTAAKSDADLRAKAARNLGLLEAAMPPGERQILRLRTAKSGA